MRDFWTSRYRNYWFLLPLFALLLIYQVAYTYTGVRAQMLDSQISKAPFEINSEARVEHLSAPALAAGLKEGDRVLSINGRRLVGERDMYEAVLAVPAGQTASFEVVPKQGSVNRTLRWKLEPRHDKSDPGITGSPYLGYPVTAMLLLCVLAGIYVAAVLPDDPRALILFGLLFATSKLISVGNWYDMPRPFWFPALFLGEMGAATWAYWLVFFGLYFPEKFRWDSKRPWLKWMFFGPTLAVNCLFLVGSMASYFKYDFWPPAITRLGHSVSFYFFCLAGAMVAGFFVSLGVKARTASSSDARRRLRILSVGSLLSFAPIIGLIIYGSVTHGNNNKMTRPVEIAVVVAVLFLFLFPITLAYVIVVERAMNVRMVLRQSLRYTLTRGGLRLLLTAIATAIFIPLNNVVFGSMLESGTKIGISVGAGVLFAYLIRTARTRVLTAVDRRFFREAYNSELILEELSDRVRSIVDEKQLFETVAQKIDESLHVPRCSFLQHQDGAYRPVFCFGFKAPDEAALHAGSKTLDVLNQSKTAPQIHFDRPDSWVHSAGELELVTLKGIHAQLLLPVGSKDNLLGILTLGPKLSEEPYSSSDIRLLRAVASQTGFALENTRLTKAFASEVAQRERLNREIEIAREVQERLFPQHMPAIAGVDFSGHCRPAQGVGGDYYDFLELPNGDLGIAIGDVSGKGIAAALLMASLQASLRGQVLSGQGNLARLMSNVNQLVYEATPSNRYATFFYGQFHHETCSFRYVNAGHNPPFILRRTPDGPVHVIRLETGGPVVGLLPRAPFQEGVVALEPGDIFIGFTDGISEAMNACDEEWGEERFIPYAAAHSGGTASDLIPRPIAEADRFADGAPQHDDMTLVVLKLAAS